MEQKAKENNNYRWIFIPHQMVIYWLITVALLCVSIWGSTVTTDKAQTALMTLSILCYLSPVFYGKQMLVKIDQVSNDVKESDYLVQKIYKLISLRDRSTFFVFMVYPFVIAFSFVLMGPLLIYLYQSTESRKYFDQKWDNERDKNRKDLEKSKKEQEKKGDK